MVDIVAQISRVMQLPENTAVLIPGNEKSIPMNGGEFGNCCASGVRYDPEERILVEYDEVADEQFTLTTSVNNKQNFPIFEDKMRGIAFRPVRRFVDVRIDVEYQASGIVVATRWLDEQRIRISRGGAELTLDAQYSYAVPDGALALLANLYETMQASEFPSELTYQEWVTENWKAPMTELTTLWGTHPRLTVLEHQYDLVGWFDFTSTPDKPMPSDDNTGRYMARVSYFLRYERPTHLHCLYPMVMHQRPIGRKFRPTVPYSTYHDVLRRVTKMREAFDYSFVLMQQGYIPYISHPDTDDWVTQDIPRERFTFFSGLLSLSCPNPEHLLDLTKMGKYTFRCYFLEYLSQVGDRAIGPNGLFEFRLYRGDEWTRTQLEFVPGTLILRSKEPLDPRYVYHIQASINRNWFSVANETWQCLRRYPTMTWTLFKLFGVGIGKRPLAEVDLLGAGAPRRPSLDCPGEGTSEYTAQCPTIDRGILKWSDITDARQDEDATVGNQVTKDRVGPMTVLFGEIIAVRKE
jgi:hypothetical protein